MTETAKQNTFPETNFPWDDIFVCGYGTCRNVIGSASYEVYSQRNAVMTLFDDKVSLWNPEVALLRLDKNFRNEIERRILRILLLDSTDYNISTESGRPLLNGPWLGALPLDNLSDGYRSTIQWLSDFMAWAIIAERFSGTGGATGILIIDELEQHLHPRWQRHILQRLRLQLPNIQIVASTHTPLIVAGTSDIEHSKVFVLKSTRKPHSIEVSVLDPDEIRGKRADQILASEAFGLATSRSPGFTDATSRYTELHAKKRTEAEEKEIKNLEEKLNNEIQNGESEYERIVKAAVTETLKGMLKQPLNKAHIFELHKQLTELSGNQ
jgi:hypothetical protein